MFKIISLQQQQVKVIINTKWQTIMCDKLIIEFIIRHNASLCIGTRSLADTHQLSILHSIV